MLLWPIIFGSFFFMPVVTGIIAEKRKRDFFAWAVLEILTCTIAFCVGYFGRKVAGQLALVSGASVILILPGVLLYLPPPKEEDTLTLDMPLPPKEEVVPFVPASTEQRGET